MGEGPSARRRSILVPVIAGMLALVVCLALGIHLSPVRRLVLRSLLPLAGSAGLRVQVESLDYNLFRLSATARGVKVAASGTPDQPFFEADTVTVAAPSSVLRALFSLARVEIVGGRVRILRTARGSNLPSSSSLSTSEPGPLVLGHVTADLAVDVRDEVSGFSVNVRRLSADLSPTGGRLVADNGRIVFRGQTVSVTRMAGGASFDGRALAFQGMDLTSDVATARVDGTLRLITRTTGMDLRLSGVGNVARLAALATPARVFDGQATFEGSLAGPFTAPVADMRVRSGRLDRDKVALTEVDLTTRVDVNGADISQSTFSLAGGRVDAAAHLAFDGTRNTVEGKWANVDVPSLINALVERPPAFLPAGPTSGTLTSEGTGFDLPQWTTAANLSVGSAVSVRDRLAMSGQSQLRIAAGSWRLDGRHRVGEVAPVGFSLSGRIESDGRVPLGGAVELAATEVPALVAVLRQVGLIDLPQSLLTGGTATATGVVGGDLEMLTLKGVAMLDGLRGDTFTLDQARVAFEGMPFEADFQLDAHADSAQVAGQAVSNVEASARISDAVIVVNVFSAAEPAGAGTLRGSGRYEIDTRAYDLQADVSNWLVSGTADVPAKGLLNLSVTGAGTVDRPGGNARATVTEARYADIALGTMTAQASLDGQTATVDVDVPLLNVKGRGQSGLTAPYNATADVTVQALDLSRLQSLVSAPGVTLQGTATGTAHAAGALSSWQDATVTVNLASAEAFLGDLAVALDGPAQVIYSSGTVGVVRLGARAGGLQAELRGSLPLDASPSSSAAMTMTLTGDVGDLITAARATHMVDVPVIAGTGPVAVTARVDGAVRVPRVTADIDLGPASINAPDLPAFERVRLLGHVENGRAEVRDLFASADGAEITATGSAPLSWASPVFPAPPSATAGSSMAMLSARLKNVTATLLGRLATGTIVPDLQGSLDATVELSSAIPEWSGLTGEARIDRLEVSAANLAVTQRTPTRIIAQDGFARIASWDWTGEGTTLSVTGQVRLSNLQTGILVNGELDLRLLSPFLRSSGVATAGALTPRISITGELNHPRIDGDLTLADADVRLASPRVLVSGLTGHAIFSRDNLQIVSAVGSINGGDLKLGGSVSFAEGAPFDARLTADVSGMALDYPEGLRTQLDGSLRLELKDVADGFDRVPLLSGSLHIVNGSYREPITVVGGLLAALQSRSTPVLEQSSPGSMPPLAFDVTVTADEDIVVDNNVATLAFDADVRLIGTAAQPGLSGRAEVREGGRVLLGRNTYRVTSGTLDFANPSLIDPDLNFQLTTNAGGVAIDVALTGTASAPKLALSSEAGELAQSDLTSLLLTGRTFDQLGSADAALVGEVLVGNLSGEVGQVLGLAGRAVGIDTIRLGGIDDPALRSDPTAIATATDPTSRLTFTKSVGSNLDVTFSQSLRYGDAQTWVVDYLPSRRLLARLVSDDENLRTYEFRHDVQFGANALARSRSATNRRTTVQVSEVTVTGTLPGQDVRHLLKLKAGNAFDFGTLQNDRERLEGFYRDQGYLTVRVGARQTPSAEAVAVAFTIQPGPRTRIEFAGAPLSKTITDRIAGLWADSIAGPLLVDEARVLVGDRLAEEGYFRSMVIVRLSEVNGVQVLTIDVDRGPLTSEVSITINGLSDDLRDELSGRLSAEDLVALAPRNTQAVADSLQLALRDKGYLQPRVSVDSPVFMSQMAVVNVHVQTGDQVLLGPVTVTGSTLPSESVRQALDLTEGLSYLQAAVDNAKTRLTSFYRQEGYPAATVTAQTSPVSAQGGIAVAVMVNEGPRQVVTAVRVDGLRQIHEDVALRAMALDVGQAARAEDLLHARTRLFATGLFRRVDVAVTAEPDNPALPGQRPMRVVATVEEWPTLRLRYGFQVAEERPAEGTGRRELVPGFSADVTRRTLFGRAVSLGGATVVQRRDRLGRIFATAPTFFARPLRSSLVMQKEREEFAGDNVSDTTSVSWEQRARTFGRLELSYAYRFERVHSFVTGPPNPDFPVFDISLNVARLTASAAWDSRNDIAAPFRGSLFTSSVEDAADLLGSQIRFIRYFGQARHFQAWRGTVFASAFQYGIVHPLGGQEVIPSERFYTGGGTSIRGLPDDGAGERDLFGAVGGRVLLLLNQEARIPLHRWFQAVAFVDAGNVFKSPRDASFGNLVTSAGLGLRFVTPFALLRADYGHVVGGASSGDSRARWTFGIGHAF